MSYNEREDYHYYLAMKDADRIFSAAEGMAKRLDKCYQREEELQENLDKANGVIQQLITAFDSGNSINVALERAREYMNAG
jgi:hypothetical protein